MMKLTLIIEHIYKIALSTLLLMAFSSISIAKNELNYVVISGQVTNIEHVNPVEGHTVYIISDSTQDGFNGYQKMLTTNREGYYYDTIRTAENKGSLIICTYDYYGKPVDTTVHFRFIDRGSNIIIANFAVFMPYQTWPLQARFKYVQKPEDDRRKFSFIDQTDNDYIISWHWDFGDSVTSNLQNPVHEYQSYGLFKITFTVTALIYNVPKTSTITKQLYISDREYYHMGGHAFSEYFPIDMGYAYLYLIDSADCYFPIDTIAFDTLGYYYFYQVPTGDYVVKIEPMRESEYYGTLLPTYYGDELFWDGAEIIHLSHTCWEYNINLAHSNGPSAGGGSISGNVEYVDPPRASLNSASGVNIYLFDESDDLLTCHYSDDLGVFVFDLIELGTYWLYPEITGIYAEKIEVELTPGAPNANNIEIYIQTTGINYVFPDEGLSRDEVVGLPYPNPASGILNVPLCSTSGNGISYEVYDIYGHMVFSGNIDMMNDSNSYQISTTGIKNGSYVVRTKVNGNTYDRVFVVAR